MKTLGINFAQNDLRVVALCNDNDQLSIVEKSKIVYPNMTTSPLMAWFETQLELLIHRHEPDKIGYKTSLSLNTIKQIQRACYPQAILNLVAQKNSIPITYWTSQGINATKFGEPKSTNVYTYIDTVLGTHPPYWDKSTKDALLTAWFCLL